MPLGIVSFLSNILKATTTYLNGLNGLKNGEGLHLDLHFGFTFFLLQKRSVLIGFTLGFTFYAIFFSDLPVYTILIGFIFACF